TPYKHVEILYKSYTNMTMQKKRTPMTNILKSMTYLKPERIKTLIKAK
ncbi:8576_t:CDS:2, partial [Gigaspora margarita]